MIWNKTNIDADQVREISQTYDLDLLTSSILARRGVTKPEDIRFFIEEDLRFLHNPFDFDGMDDLVDRLKTAQDEEERVLIFGDRDVDGITSTVILYQALMKLGLDVRWLLPKGDDPYGLTIDAVEEFAADSGTLILTVDCGISNNKEVKRANELGIDVIVVDHHNPGEDLPEAFLIINPKMENCGYSHRDLAGCGVASKVAFALAFGQTELYNQSFCLLNIRPLNDSYVVEAIKVLNLKVQDRLYQVVVPGVGDPKQMGILDFLQNQPLFVYDGEVQSKMLDKVFGKAYEFHYLDLAEKIAEAFPPLAGQSLLRMKSKSRLSRYTPEKTEEIDVFFSLFITYLLRGQSQLMSVYQESLDLVALGTLADLMDLRDENRILVRQGLGYLSETSNPGLRELLRKLKLSGKKISASDVAWQISPVINSTGRMGQPEKAAQLLTSQDPEEIRRLVEEIVGLNQERRQLGEESWKRILPLGRESFERHNQKICVIFDPDIPRGITGILAARLVQMFDVPAMVCTRQDDYVIGSMRANRNFNAMKFLKSLEGFFRDYGGHDAAAGFSLDQEKRNDFLVAVESGIKTFELEESQEDQLNIDAELPPQYMTPELMDVVDRLEPYGEGHRPLVFSLKEAVVESVDLIGKGEKKHVKLLLGYGKYKWPAVFWNGADRVGREIHQGKAIDLAFHLGRNNFYHQESLQLTVLDVK